jgi:hypothetical protein
MTATPSTLAQPGLRGRTAPIIVAAIFIFGVLTGLLAAQFALPSLAPATGAIGAGDPSWPLYEDYRSGERDVPTATFTREQIQQAWMDFRAGERDATPSR